MCEADLSNLAELRSRLDACQAETGGFDVVINNAAIYPSKPFEEFTIEEFQAVQRVNVDAGIVCVQAALPHMRQKGWGRIINVTSITVLWRLGEPCALCAVQGRADRPDARLGARVRPVRHHRQRGRRPAPFRPMRKRSIRIRKATTRFVLDHQAVKRRGQPGDIAHALMFLASERSGFITGQTLNVDGGWVMH